MKRICEFDVSFEYTHESGETVTGTKRVTADSGYAAKRQVKHKYKDCVILSTKLVDEV